MENGLWSIQGRIDRGTYWKRWALAFLINFMAAFFAGLLDAGPLSLLISLTVTIFMWIQGVKRMHDVDKSGWCMLIPIYNFILLLLEGDRDENRYGVSPAAWYIR